MKTITAKTPEQVREWVTNNPHYRGGWLDAGKNKVQRPSDARYFELANREERFRIPLSIHAQCFLTAMHKVEGYMYQWDEVEEKVYPFIRKGTVRITLPDATIKIGEIARYDSDFENESSFVILDDGKKAELVYIDKHVVIELPITTEEIKSKIEALDFDGDDRDDATIAKWESLIDPVSNGELLFDRP